MGILVSASLPLLPAIIILVIAGTLALLFARRETLSYARIRAVPRGNNRLIMIAAIMLAVSGIAGRLLTQFHRRIASEPSLWTIAALIAAGVLFLFCEKRKWLPEAAAFILTVAVGSFYAGSVPDTTLPPIILSALLVFLSTIGWRQNIVFKGLPQRLALPALNLVSSALVLLYIPSVARGLESQIVRANMPPVLAYLYAVVRLLPLVSVLLINMACETQIAEACMTKACTRAVPRGRSGFRVASWLLLACGIVNMLVVMLRAYDVSALLLTLPLVAAGLLLVIGKGGEKHFIAASACLFLSAAVNFFQIGSYTTPDFWMYSFPILLMLVSAIGASRNGAFPVLSRLTCAPVLNVFAAALLMIGIVTNAMSFTEQISLIEKARAARVPATVKLAADTGRTVSQVSYYTKTVEEAIAAFDKAVAAHEAAMKTARDSMDTEKIANYTEVIQKAADGLEEFEALAAKASGELEAAVSVFRADLLAISKQADAAFEQAVLEGGDGFAHLMPPAAAAPEAAADDADTALDPAQAAEAAWLEVLSAQRTAASTFAYATGRMGDVHSALDKASASIESDAQTARAETARLCSLAIRLLAAVGLVLLNLTLGSREVAQRGLFAALIQICRKGFGWFYRDVGGKLQTLARIQALLCMVVACLSAAAAAVGLSGFFVNFFFLGLGFENLMVFFMGIGGILASFILALPTWFLYAFGQITADVHAVKESDGPAVPDCCEENPDDLPEI